jgi:hypothetical protein
MYKTLHRKLNIGQHEPGQQIYIKGKYPFPFSSSIVTLKTLLREVEQYTFNITPLTLNQSKLLEISYCAIDIDKYL